MRQAKIIVGVVERELLPHTLLALTERHDAPSYCGDMLADGEVDALHEGRVDLPAVGGQHLLDGRQGAEHYAATDADQTASACGLDDLRIEQLRQRHPPRLGHGAWGVAALRLHPLTEMRQQRRGVLLEAVGQEERHTTRG